jgi:hypothetical protein
MKGLSEVLFENSFPQKDAKKPFLGFEFITRWPNLKNDVVRNIVHAFTEI